MIPLLYEDNSILVVEKAAGLLSVPGKGPEKQDSLILRIRRSYPGALIVHRLDQPTSGLMVVALTPNAHRTMSRQFEDRLVIKEYEALVWGDLPLDEGEVDLSIRADINDRPRQIVDTMLGKRSLTGWKILEKEGDLTRVRLFPHTGRTHQLRVHMQAMGTPIAGDRLYSPEEQADMHPRLMLHASYLSFPHPDKPGEMVGVFSPVPF